MTALFLLLSIACGGSTSGTAAQAGTDADQPPAVRYITELKRRIYAQWKIPTASSGAVALACVRLEPGGSIAQSAVTRPSGDPVFDHSVEVAIQDTAGMDEPVPGELQEFLVARGLCFHFAAP
jgi:outer membrane biosynthesis protein TonB